MTAAQTQIRLLITGGGGAGAEALHRLLSDRYDVHFADADPEAKPASIPMNAWHHIPFASAPDFVDRVGQLCRTLGVDLLIPGVDEELIALARSRATLDCEVLLPPAAFVEGHLDKLASQALLRSSGTAVPETEWLPERKRVTFPCIVKPRTGRGSRDVVTVTSEAHVQAHLMMCRRPATEFIAQELLRGQEYTVTMVADRTGTLRAIVPVKVGLKRGITLRAETDADARVTQACARIHAGSPVSGCFNIQLIKDEAGDVRPFEVNPRISTTTCLALAAGVNFVDLFLEPSSAHSAPALAPFTDRLQLRRSWQNEFR